MPQSPACRLTPLTRGQLVEHQVSMEARSQPGSVSPGVAREVSTWHRPAVQTSQLFRASLPQCTAWPSPCTLAMLPRGLIKRDVWERKDPCWKQHSATSLKVSYNNTNGYITIIRAVSSLLSLEATQVCICCRCFVVCLRMCVYGTWVYLNETTKPNQINLHGSWDIYKNNMHSN